jgi:hypothetical protein
MINIFMLILNNDDSTDKIIIIQSYDEFFHANT